MKKYIFAFIIISIPLISCYADDKIKQYMKSNNMNYPINFGVLTENTKYYPKEWWLGEYSIETQPLELTIQQKQLLDNFISKLKKDKKYINTIQKESRCDTFSIDRIDVFNVINVLSIYADNFYVGIIFYTINKITEHSEYDENYQIWKTTNFAIYSMENGAFEFRGWYK